MSSSILTANLDERNTAILERRSAMYDRRSGPRVGDYVIMPGGQRERFTYDWHDGTMQTGNGGSWYIGELADGHAYVSFSGALNPSIAVSQLHDTGETAPGSFWFFDRDIWGAGRGVDVKIPCRVYALA